MGAATIAAMEIDDVQVRGTKMRVRRFGDGAGRPLFYWHGGGGGSDETPVLEPRLVAAGYTLYAVDAPGYGDSPPLEPERYASPELAALAAELLDGLGLAPAVWLGFSWGASIGVHTAALFPDSVRALGLLDGGYLVAEDDPDYDPDTDYEDELEELRRRAEAGETWDAPTEVIGAAMVASRLAPCPPLYPALAKSGIPILLARATAPPELESLRRAAVRRFRAGLPDARIVRIPNATHGILGDNGPEVIRVLLRWLDELG
jgi:pimeloyl-ACP methyl ester carboxylesterase